MPPFYIGSTSIKRLNAGYRGSVASRKFKDIWKHALKTEPEKFVTEVISEHQSRKDALDAERELHIILDVVNNPLFINMALAGVGPRNNGFGRPMSPKTREALLLANTGRKHTDETKAKMRRAHEKRQPVSDEIRAKMREGHKNRPKPKPMSDETKAKISASRRGQQMSEEAKLKLSMSLKERLKTPEARANLARAGKARWSKP